MGKKKDSISRMFNRLPLYSRKEPQIQIGAPVLTQTTNERLSGRPVIIGPDGRQVPPALGGGPPTFGRHGGAAFDRRPSHEKGLPEIPRSAGFADEFRVPMAADPSGLLLPDEPVSGSRQLPDDPRQPRKHKVARKPVSPSASVVWGETGTTTTGYSEYRDGNYKGTGFALGNLVKERVAAAGRRQHQALPPLPTDTEDETSVIRPSPAGLNSIDDWLDSREGLHKRSNTVSTVATQYTRQPDNLKLHIRQSTFEPLHPSDEDSDSADEGETIMPIIPVRFLRKPSPAPRPARTSSLQPREAPQQPRGSHQRELPRRPPSPPTTPKEPEKPRNHIEQLEYEQAAQEERKTELRSEIWGIEQTLKIATTDRGLRERLKQRLDGLNQEYADAEKSAHDLGLKLYRAYRRQDKRDGVEGPTHLWVSRVTAPLDD